MTDVSKDCSASTLRFKMLGTMYTRAQCHSQKTVICRLSQAFVFSFMGLLYIDILLSATGLTPSGSSTIHIYTQTIHRTTQLIWED